MYKRQGLVLFLTGVNVGFSPAGNYLGQVLAALPYRWVIVPIGMLIGYFIVRAEPAVFVLTKQVEEITDGAISAESMGLSLSIGVSISCLLYTSNQAISSFNFLRRSLAWGALAVCLVISS